MPIPHASFRSLPEKLKDDPVELLRLLHVEHMTRTSHHNFLACHNPCRKEFHLGKDHFTVPVTNDDERWHLDFSQPLYCPRHQRLLQAE